VRHDDHHDGDEGQECADPGDQPPGAAHLGG
jgi:hypothetical protein